MRAVPRRAGAAAGVGGRASSLCCLQGHPRSCRVLRRGAVSREALVAVREPSGWAWQLAMNGVLFGVQAPWTDPGGSPD